MSEVTTSNNFPSSASTQLQAQTQIQSPSALHKGHSSKTKAADQTVVKSEIKSPTGTSSSSTVSLSIASLNMDHSTTNSVQSGQYIVYAIFVSFLVDDSNYKRDCNLKVVKNSKSSNKNEMVTTC